LYHCHGVDALCLAIKPMNFKEADAAFLVLECVGRGVVDLVL
jgi:hypothetical protein